MQMSVLRGHLVSVDPMFYDADLSKVDRANAAYEEMIQEETEKQFPIRNAHKNFLKEVVYLLYTHNRLAEANQWFQRLREKYPDAIPGNKTVEEYSLEKVMGNLADPSHDRTKAILEGVIVKHYLYVALDDDAQAEGYDRMAQQIWSFYQQRIQKRQQPLTFPPLAEMKRAILEQLLGPQSRFNPELRARLRAKLNIALPAPTTTSTTNAPIAKP